MSLQVEVLEQSFESIKPCANEFVGSFYENLFTANPEAKPLFEHTDMASQKKMLLNSLVMVVENLRNPDVLDKSLRGLGARHVKYGALPAHYPLVGGALLTTFEQYLGEKWTPKVKEAWVGAYGAISEIMLDGADYSEADVALATDTEEAEAGLQVELLESSFEEIKPQANEFVGSFYENLFTANPEAKPLFEHTDMASQKKMLLNSLVMVVENLRKPDVLDKALRGLGARHVKYGALPAHYPLVGGALLTSFEQYLGDKWTPDVKQAWVGAYGAISEIMLDGADYSQGEIALESEPSNTEIAPPETQPLANSNSVPSELNSSNNPAVVSSPETTDDLNHDSGKATIAALTGGGILGIIATILVMLV
ncbi:MAG: globin family protein [Cyanobacteria bacterium J06621_12]